MPTFETQNKTDLYLTGDIGFDISAKNFIKSLQAVNTPNICVHIDSLGGNVFDGLSIYNALKDYTGKKTAIIEGVCASAASYILMAFDEVIAKANALLMIHNPLVENISGNASELLRVSSTLAELSKIYIDAYTERTHLPYDYIKEMMDNETYFNAQQAKEKGFVDIIEGEQTIALEKAKAEIKKQQDAYSKSILKSEEARKSKLAESDKLLYDYSFNRLSPEEKISELTKSLTADKQKLAEMDKNSTHYANFKNELTKKYIELKKLQDDQEKTESDKKKKEADDAKKKIEAQQKSYQEFLKEHNLQKQIATAKYQGNTALAEQLKKQSEVTKLADKYGISLKEAYKILKEQDKIKDINDNGGNNKYSEKDVKKAQRILERGEKGNVGKRTLEEAQAIVDGKDPEGGFRMATFKNVGRGSNQRKSTTKKNAGYNPYQFSSTNTARNKNVDNQTATTPEQTQNSNNQKENIQETFFKDIKETLNEMKELLTSIKNETQAVAQSKKHS